MKYIGKLAIDIPMGTFYGIAGGWLATYNVLIGVVVATLGFVLVFLRILITWEERQRSHEKSAREKEEHDLKLKMLNKQIENLKSDKQ